MSVVLNLPAVSPEDVWGAQNNANLQALKDGVDAASSAGGALSNVPNIDATQRSNQTGTQLAATISDLASAVLATVAAALQGGTGISVTFDGTHLTIASTTVPGAVYATHNGSSYPTRASVTSNLTQPVIFRGPDNNKVTVDATYCLDGVDEFEGW